MTGYTDRKVERSIVRARKRLHAWHLDLAKGERCVTLQDALERVADREADARERRMVSRHVRHCGTCRATLRARRQTNAGITVLVPVALVGAGAAGPIVAPPADGKTTKIKILGHCEEDRLATVLQSAAGPEVPLAEASGDTVWLVSQGFQLVPMDWRDLLRELTHLDLRVFLPWFAFATLVKLLGIFANIYRWQILLRGQGLRFDFPWLTASYFVGRYWGIVTPSTMGLDGWRLYDTIKITGKPVECATALAVERLIGLVGLLATILLIMPFVDTSGRSLGELVSAMAVPLACAVIFAFAMLVKPTWFTWLPRLIPVAKVRNFVQNAITSATAYSSKRSYLLFALAMAIIGQVTTIGMYFANARALGVADVSGTELAYATAVMTFGTFIAPSASGEGVRELVFVNLLQGKTTQTMAFLIAHLGFWIEKLPLSIPGGLLLFLNPERFKPVSQEELAAVRQGATPPAT
jgi:uncharacterized membrane protein YbhN (UPF0104 family)